MVVFPDHPDQQWDIQAVLFDLDGTLVDSVPDIAAALNEVEQQFRLPSSDLAQVRQWVGNGAAKLVERAMRSHQIAATPDHTLAFFAAYERVNGRHSRLFKGVADGLRSLQAKALPMIVVTNKPHQFVEPLLEELEIASFFSAFYGGDSVENKKPAPDMLLAACQALELDARQALMVGDSLNDVEAGRRAGCPIACVSYGYSQGHSIDDIARDYHLVWHGDDLNVLAMHL